MVLPWNVLNPSNVIWEAHNMVAEAMDWCCHNNIRYNYRQASYFIRAVAIACVERGNLAGYEDAISKFSYSQRMRGGKRINQFVNGLADAKVFGETE